MTWRIDNGILNVFQQYSVISDQWRKITDKILCPVTLFIFEKQGQTQELEQ